MADNDEEDPFDNLDLEQDDADKNDGETPSCKHQMLKAPSIWYVE